MISVYGNIIPVNRMDPVTGARNYFKTGIANLDVNTFDVRVDRR